ncbi:MAG TPA: hypothetical protein VEG08_02645 [Terriglobales bacterium]|nr:hypothetical protein [Terriglobales bacterium]
MRTPPLSLALGLPLLLAAMTLLSVAQQPPRAASAVAPVVTFTLDFPQARPQHAVVAVDASGRAQYHSTGPLFADASEAEPYRAAFTLSVAARERIFALAAELDDFQGDFDYKKHRIAFTGQKTLEYADGNRKFSTSYNWSENPSVRELTQIFQSIINTQESARRLLFLRRYDHLGLEAELEGMEEMAKSNSLGELQSIAPLLRQLADDPAVMHVARQRAERLWARTQPVAGTPAVPSPTASPQK